MHDRGLFADIFHDIDFPRSRPSYARGRDVFPKHPERRPNALPTWNLYSRFNFSVLYFKQTLSLDAAGREPTGV
jgi:hypothetical protein